MNNLKRYYNNSESINELNESGNALYSEYSNGCWFYIEYGVDDTISYCMDSNCVIPEKQHYDSVYAIQRARVNKHE